MAFSLSNIILTDKYNFSESRRHKAFEEIENNKFPLDYSFYRLRFFIINLILNVTINSILFASYFKTRSLDLFYIHLILAVLLQFWWGATHSLIREVKNKIYFNDKPAVNQLFNSWIGRTIIITFVLLLVLPFIFLQFFPQVKLTILIFVLIRFIFKFIYRVFYSLIFAASRVYTPFYFILLTDLIFVLVIYFSTYNDGFITNIFLLITSLLNFALFSFIAIKQAKKLDLIDIEYFKKRLKNLEFKLSFGFNRQFIYLGISALALTSNFFLLFHAKSNEMHSVFLILPFLIICQNWLKPFYFDLTDIKILIDRGLRKNYIKYLFKNSPIIIVLTCFIYQAFCILSHSELNKDIITFILASSVFSIFVYNEFSKSNLKNVSVILFFEVLIIYLSKDFADSIERLTIFRTLGILFFVFIKTSKNNMLNGYNFILPIGVWSDLLFGKKSDCCVYLLKFNPNIKKSIINDLSKKLALLFNFSGRICLHGKYLLIFSDKKIHVDDIIKTAEGTIIFYKEYNVSLGMGAKSAKEAIYSNSAEPELKDFLEKELKASN